MLYYIEKPHMSLFLGPLRQSHRRRHRRRLLKHELPACRAGPAAVTVAHALVIALRYMDTGLLASPQARELAKDQTLESTCRRVCISGVVCGRSVSKLLFLLLYCVY